MTTKTKTKYKFERKGTMPKVGDYVVGTGDWWENDKTYGTPRKVQKISGGCAVCSAHREKVYFDLDLFRTGENRVLKRTSN